MKINANFDERVVVHSEEMEWISSPMAGVMRRPLDRVGGEVARATSIVKYEPGSKFSPHVHTGGEELIVLEGVFQDEHGDFPAGSYIRNPPMSSHTPGSEKGCVIFVKLWQFEPEDRIHVRLNANYMKPVPEGEAGVSISPLYFDENEEVCVQSWGPGANIDIPQHAGLEALVLEGSFIEANENLVRHSWLRLPKGQRFTATAGKEGTKVWLKLNHLGNLDQQIARLNPIA